MVFFFNTEKTDAIWEVHVSEDTFFSPFPLLEGTSLPVASSIHKLVLSLTESADTSAASSRSSLPNEKRSLSFY